jgi:ubiquinone/menaquinone biosynthesis C-methylase UbiE
MSSRQAFFNQNANTWDNQFNTPELIGFLEKIVPTFHLKPAQKILDVGTGTGILIPFLLKAIGPTGYVTAVDYSEEMVKICKAKYGSYPNVDVMVKDVENLPFSNETFDAITCFGLFPHLENKKKALREMNRVLKLQGKLIIAHALSSIEIANYHHTVSPVVAHDALPTAEKMCKLLRENGFGNVQITDEPGRYLCMSTRTA